MKSQSFITPELHKSLFSLQGHLTETCAEFVRCPSIQKHIGADNATILLQALSSENGLQAFRNGLHQCVVECLGHPDFDSTYYWALIDSINFWDGAFPGRWHYMTDPQRQRWMEWSKDAAEQVFRSLTH